jgi:cytochrome P450
MTTYQFNPLSRESIEDPYASYALLRERDPVHWHDVLQSWVISRHDDCVRVLKDPDLFGSDWRRVGKVVPPEVLGVQTLDPPEHTVLRRGLSAILRSRPAESLRPRISQHARQLVDMAVEQRMFDVVSDLAGPLALDSICALLGVPVPSLNTIQQLSTAIVDSMDAGLAPSTRAPGQRARAQLSAEIEVWLRHGEPAGLALIVR